MKTKMNIATILKDKPKNTKLYSPIFGDVYFSDVENSIIKVIHQGKMVIFFGDGRYYNYPESEPLLFPSKEMRNWERFAWKRGDALIMNGCKVVFDKWVGDDYTRFNAVHLITSSGGYFDKPLQNRYTPISNFITKSWRKMTDLETKIYMESLERECGSKLNLITLNIEKQPEFKDGDVLFVKCKGNAFIELFNCFKNNGDLCDYVSLDTTTHELDISGEYKIFKENIMKIRLATEEEKLQLFNAILAKKGKTWDIEKKMIVDVKPKVDELKPFDKVLVRDDKEDQWSANIFSYQVRDVFHCLGESYWRYYIPYEGNEHLLGTTKDVED